LSRRGLDSLDDAYAVQRELTALRLGRGETIIGWKLGYTSRAMREQMHIAAPNYGPLTDAMMLPDGTVPPHALQPRVEPEIALLLARPVPLGADVAEVLTCCVAAYGCLEVVDSVWTDYRFTLLDNTADGSSAGWVVIGAELPLRQLDAVDVRLFADDQFVAEATGAEAGGHPALGVAWLAEQLRDDPRGLRAGDVVITGGLTAATPLRAGGAVRAEFADGRVHVAVARPSLA
jgi:2-keto-4-pentenoate hydratase